MDNKIIDGKLISDQIKKEIAAEVADMIDHGKPAPHLAAVIVGEDGASQTYVASKEKACHSVGMTSSVYRLPVILPLLPQGEGRARHRGARRLPHPPV